MWNGTFSGGDETKDFWVNTTHKDEWQVLLVQDLKQAPYPYILSFEGTSTNFDWMVDAYSGFVVPETLFKNMRNAIFGNLTKNAIKNPQCPHNSCSGRIDLITGHSAGGMFTNFLFSHEDRVSMGGTDNEPPCLVDWNAFVPSQWVLRIFFKILVIGANFAKFWWIWINFGPYRLENFGKVCHVCDLILGSILENFDFGNFEIYQSYDKPPLRIFDFWSNFWFWWKSNFWNS